MMQEPHVAEQIRQSYRHVDLVFGPHALWKFPEMIYTLSLIHILNPHSLKFLLV